MRVTDITENEHPEQHHGPACASFVLLVAVVICCCCSCSCCFCCFLYTHLGVAGPYVSVKILCESSDRNCDSLCKSQEWFSRMDF